MPVSDPDVSRPRLVRDATFLEADRREIALRRGPHNRLGFAYRVALRAGARPIPPTDAPGDRRGDPEVRGPAAIERVVDEFEETAWAGLEGDRYVWSAVLHRDDDDGGVHVHLFAARCELTTGRSLNIAPPGWQKTFDPLRDALNYEHDWSRPDDPARARPFRPSRAYLDAETLRAGWEVEPNPRELIGEHLMARVVAGTVTDGGGVVGALEELGLEVPRQGKHYVTARHPETGDRWRLKGTLYERDFDRERFVRQLVPEPPGAREPTDRGDDGFPVDPAAAVEQLRARLSDAFDRFLEGVADNRQVAFDDDGVAAEDGRGRAARPGGNPTASPSCTAGWTPAAARSPPVICAARVAPEPVMPERRWRVIPRRGLFEIDDGNDGRGRGSALRQQVLFGGARMSG